jgi:hypothetical protein
MKAQRASFTRLFNSLIAIVILGGMCFAALPSFLLKSNAVASSSNSDYGATIPNLTNINNNEAPDFEIKVIKRGMRQPKAGVRRATSVRILEPSERQLPTKFAKVDKYEFPTRREDEKKTEPRSSL